MYATTNFTSKKALKDAIKAGKEVGIFAPVHAVQGPPRDGIAYLEGPHYPEPHRWYAKVELKDGVIVKVVQ